MKLTFIAFLALSSLADASVIVVDAYDQKVEYGAGAIFGTVSPDFGDATFVNSSVAFQFSTSIAITNVSVSIEVQPFYEDTLGVPTIAIYSNSIAGTPGQLLSALAVSGESLSTTLNDTEVANFGPSLILEADASYWLVLSAEAGDTFSWLYADHESDIGLWRSQEDGEWFSAGGSAAQIRIEGLAISATGVPEVSTVALSLLGSFSLLRRRRHS